ncbi:membrane protein [Pilimelia terevasa]|uniref:Membrane protein n=1 Tax=Pilimelia terevasa TaxID=53372 RepID=A0A8J3BUV0_9ACTN|nr:alpha/beta-hydrolase family protein [Pilimelia terevasa]GGK41882.1 membrane protein [Pilimelia terevasa]
MTATKPERPGPPEAPEPPARGRWWRLRHRWHYTFVGVVGALVFFCLSLTPSLLPRGLVLQSLVSGITAAIGYGLGVLLVWLAGTLSDRPVPGPRPVLWRWLGIAAVPVLGVALYQGSVWQEEVHRLMGMTAPSQFGYLAVLLLAAVTAAAFVGLARMLRAAARATGRLLGRWVPAATARTVAALAVALLALGLLDGVVVDSFFAVTDNAFRAVNDETEPGTAPPEEPLRSGGPGSLVSWASLGNQGRQFVTGGPGPQELSRVAGADARRPIRVYAGLDSAPTSRQRAQLAVRDLQRTGAFQRDVLVVIITTGTGWVDEQGVVPLEYMYRGNTAMVALQYSYQPSWLSFLVDKERAREAGRDLYNQVYGVWSRMPLSGRPKLLVFGESLGSFGAESAFGGADDIRNRVDGMLLVGPPNRNALWRGYVAARDPGSPEILPRYEQGATIRFARDPAVDLDQPGTWWGTPRAVYLQHPSDPIVWWAPKLIVSRPDWLREPRGVDVSPRMRWYPFVTFWQVTADMAFSTGVPPGHGHGYGTAPVAAWAQIAPPEGWTPARTAALTALIAGG